MMIKCSTSMLRYSKLALLRAVSYKESRTQSSERADFRKDILLNFSFQMLLGGLETCETWRAPL